MILHTNRKAFLYAIKIAEKETGFRPIFLEKDYWVTLTLKRLAESPYTNDVVFKGGTSLSKCYNIIDRFSEDVDLAINNHTERSPGDIKRLLKKVETSITVDLAARPDNSGKKGLKRTTTHDYQRFVTGTTQGALASGLNLEITAYSQAFPSYVMDVGSYMAQSLIAISEEDFVSDFQLNQFPLNVLGLERTFAEKVMALVKLAYSDDYILKLRDKVRHVYDLQQILAKAPSMALFLKSDSFFDFLDAVSIDDRSNKTSDLEWLDYGYGDCCLFANPEKVWPNIVTAYTTSFKELVFGELPSSDEIIEALEIIGARLKTYDMLRDNRMALLEENINNTIHISNPRRGPKM